MKAKIRLSRQGASLPCYIYTALDTGDDAIIHEVPEGEVHTVHMWIQCPDTGSGKSVAINIADFGGSASQINIPTLDPTIGFHAWKHVSAVVKGGRDLRLSALFDVHVYGYAERED